jgi:hypothetical protein
MKITREQMDYLLHKAEQHMVDIFATGEITVLMKEDAELVAASIPSIMADREYFRNEFDMIIGEA